MVVATGFFDGVHLGHRFLLNQLVKAAHARGDRSMVITFWPHPRTVLQDDARALRLLTTMDEKRQLLSQLGIDEVEVIPFTRTFSRLTTEEYLKDYVKGIYGGKAVLLGYDNRIGSDMCSPEEAARIAEGLGLDVICAESYANAGAPVVSSTRIRNYLAEGNVEAAREMLGYDYMLHGVVVAGNRIGRTLGFPTANMQLYEPLKLVPGGGVYLVRVETLDRQFYGMCNIGVRPTVGSGNSMTIETNIFGFNEDIYGLDIRVIFLKKIRSEIRFPSLEALSAQLEKDRTLCMEMI